MGFSVKQWLFWVVLPLGNFALFYFYGVDQKSIYCAKESIDLMKEILDESMHALQAAVEEECDNKIEAACSHTVNDIQNHARLIWTAAEKFDEYRSEFMASNDVTGIPQLFPKGRDALMLQPDETPCTSFKHELLPGHDYTCMAVVYIKDTDAAYNIVRFDDDIDFHGVKISNPDPSQIDKYSAAQQNIKPNTHNQNKLFPTGYFRKVPKDRGRLRTKEKLGPFVSNFADIERQLDARLEAHGIKAGDDATVMVVNEGEIDLFLNFACSCRLHNITLTNVVVFAGSTSVLPLIDATGAIGMFHEGYASVSKKPSNDYLDRVRAVVQPVVHTPRYSF